jgi:hypothetical protein
MKDECDPFGKVHFHEEGVTGVIEVGAVRALKVRFKPA